jgi:hypothetical protein
MGEPYGKRAIQPFREISPVPTGSIDTTRDLY